MRGDCRKVHIKPLKEKTTPHRTGKAGQDWGLEKRIWSVSWDPKVNFKGGPFSKMQDCLSWDSQYLGVRRSMVPSFMNYRHVVVRILRKLWDRVPWSWGNLLVCLKDSVKLRSQVSDFPFSFQITEIRIRVEITSK